MAGLDDMLGIGGSLSTPSEGGVGFGSTNKDLMAEARDSLQGNWGLAVLGCLLFSLLIMSFYTFIATAVFFVTITSSIGGANGEAAASAMNFAISVVESLVSGAFIVGFCGFYLGIVQDNEARMELLFVGFRRFWKSFACYFLGGLFVFLWSLLLVVPGIIAAFRYSMAYFILADDEDCGPLQAISQSKEMMKGNKWKFFCLHWRFLGWAILSTLIPIGWIWLMPYIQTSFAKFYEDVK